MPPKEEKAKPKGPQAPTIQQYGQVLTGTPLIVRHAVPGRSAVHRWHLGPLHTRMRPPVGSYKAFGVVPRAERNHKEAS
jgi:hypothetical protein